MRSCSHSNRCCLMGELSSSSGPSEGPVCACALWFHTWAWVAFICPVWDILCFLVLKIPYFSQFCNFGTIFSLNSLFSIIPVTFFKVSDLKHCKTSHFVFHVFLKFSASSSLCRILADVLGDVFQFTNSSSSCAWISSHLLTEACQPHSLLFPNVPACF